MPASGDKDRCREGEPVVGEPQTFLGNLSSRSFVAFFPDNVHSHINRPSMRNLHAIAVLPQLGGKSCLLLQSSAALFLGRRESISCTSCGSLSACPATGQSPHIFCPEKAAIAIQAVRLRHLTLQRQHHTMTGHDRAAKLRGGPAEPLSAYHQISGTALPWACRRPRERTTFRSLCPYPSEAAVAGSPGRSSVAGRCCGRPAPFSQDVGLPDSTRCWGFV